ncbi:MAG: hypothetical protein ACPLW8_05025, partial [Candidatus Bathyarchaeales archaeon]
SITSYKDVTISKNIIEGLALLPAETPKYTPTTIVEMDSGEYVLQFNQTYNSWVMVFLGENYDPLWQVTIDGQVLSNHSMANIYGNIWFTNITRGTHEMQIVYKPNEMYRSLMYMSIFIIWVLFAVAYFPRTLLGKLRFSRKNLKLSPISYGVWAYSKRSFVLVLLESCHMFFQHLSHH